MEISARNQIRGHITEIVLGAVMAEVAIDIGAGHTLVSAITRSSAESMGLSVGMEVLAVIKATEVLIGK